MQKNKKMILAILLSILIIGIGASFAYFITQIILTGSGTTTEGTTVSLGDTNVKIEGTPDFSDTNIYPGHQTVSKVKLTATGDRLVLYNLVWNGTNTLNTTLNYTIYKTTTDENPTVSCTQNTKVQNGARILYESCTLENNTNLGEAVSSGEITTTTEETTFTLVKNEEIQATSTGEVVYYYIVLEYPNKEESQNADLKGTFTGATTIELLEKKILSTEELILANYIIDTSRSSGNFSEPYSNTTPKRIFSGEDDDGTTYFFAGASPNNWVQFGKFSENTPDVYYGYYSTTSASFKEYATLSACQNASSYNKKCTLFKKAGKDIYWRIIRINGDGSIRIIYNGATTSQTGETTQIGVSNFNDKHDDNTYIGYMYGTPGSSTYAATHANINSSTIKTYLDTWYKENLQENYEKYIDDNAGFCGDRTVENHTTNYTGNGSGKTATEYSPRARMAYTHTFTYKCANETNDLYTWKNKSYKGNKALENPIGLITIDEVVYAGGYNYVSGVTQSHWLRTGQDYWTMSPASYKDSMLNVYDEMPTGDTGYLAVIYANAGVRPVINLKEGVLNTGTGITTDPYRIA